tara:strand:- start:129 stop:548 length:420 start_codon:yes stop_codon:yes gene_type:complete
MRKDIHPEYREVLFHDTSVDEYFLVRSTLSTDQTKEYEGKTYPYCVLDISSASHPFYTGKQKLVDTGGRVDKFRKRFGNKTKTAPVAEAAAEEAPIEEVVVEEAITEEVVTEEPIVEEAASEETIVEETSVEEDASEDK